jgi:phage baseplate assembly protein gpV
MAGKAHGFSFTPEIDDEVLVAFDHGDLRSPFVVGSLWNGTDRPPTGNARGGSGVQLQLSDGKRLTFDKRGIALDDGHGNTISIEGGTGRITIEAASSIALKAPQISLESSGSLELKSSGSLTLRGSIININ